MAKKSFPLSRVYSLLEPGPVVLVSAARDGSPNIMTMSWHTMLEFEPPLVGCVISIPTVEIAEKVASCGNSSGADIDKFKTFGLTPKPASLVSAPLIEECFAHLECRVTDTGMVERYCLFVLEVIKAWIDPTVKNPRTIHHRGRGSFMVAGEIIKLKSKMK